VESELFGHERGAFTGAVARKLGKIELASGGTLLLDEIGDMPLAAQVKLLRLLEESEYERVGGTKTLRLEARVLAATNRDVQGMVEAGRFRADLFYRLQAYSLRLPPLRERLEDVPLLAVYFMTQMACHLHKEVVEVEREAVMLLQNYDWPGNVRELEHVVQRAVVVCRGKAIEANDISLGGGVSARDEKLQTPEEYERWYLKRALEASSWVLKGPHGAAAALGMPPSTLQNRLKRLGIQRP